MIIAFTGLMQSGKTTASDKLIEQGFTKINFKDALVQELKDKFPNLLRQIMVADSEKWSNGIVPCDINYLFRDKPPLMRALMQNYGTEVRRGDDPQYWIKKWGAKIDQVRLSSDIVVDDVRFLNEAEAVKFWGGYIIRIERSDLTDAGTHESETEMAQIVPDLTISAGKGELEKIYSGVVEFVQWQQNQK